MMDINVMKALGIVPKSNREEQHMRAWNIAQEFNVTIEQAWDYLREIDREEDERQEMEMAMRDLERALDKLHRKIKAKKKIKNRSNMSFYNKALLKHMLVNQQIIRTPEGMTYRPVREDNSRAYSYTEYWRYLSRDTDYCY